MSYQLFTASATDLKSLAIATAEFLEQTLQVNEYILLEHILHPDSVCIFKDQMPSFKLENWLNQNNASQKNVDSTLYLHENGFSFYFSGNDFLNEDIFIFIFKSKPGTVVSEVLKQWQLQHQYQNKIRQELNIDNGTKTGNLISQLLHDVQSLMDFQPLEIDDPEHKTRLDYQNSINENLLFYIRPIELLTFLSPVIELIYASVQILGIEKNDFKLRVSGEIADINIDAELFSKALNSIVLNAQESGNGNLIKWEIQIEQINGMSPFINQNWLQINIVDQGLGISPDYLPFVSDPFFTTKKVTGHSGFGLSNAKKIIEAQGGHLQITSVRDQGSQVKLILPYRENESKNSNY